MQAAPAIPLDLATPSSAAGSTAASGGGNDGVFSEHLAAAAQGHKTGQRTPDKANQSENEGGPTGLTATKKTQPSPDDQETGLAIQENRTTDELITIINTSTVTSPLESDEAIQPTTPVIDKPVGTGIKNNETAIAKLLDAIATTDQQKATPLLRDKTQQPPSHRQQNINVLQQESPELEKLFQQQSLNNKSLHSSQSVTVQAEPLALEQQSLLVNKAGISRTDGSQFTAVSTPSNTLATVGITTAGNNLAPGQSPTVQQATTSQLNVSVENWSANYSHYSDNQAHLKPTGQKAVNPNGAALEPQVNIQNEQGQVITVYQAAEGDEALTTTVSTGSRSTTDISGQRQDVNSSYIHSNLPHNSVKAGVENGSTQQQDGEAGQQNNTDPQLKTDQLQAQQITGSKNDVLPVFSLEQTQTAPTTAGTIETPSTSLFRLPSGLIVPEATVMDQVISHFSMKRRLESGSINLKLHPQELGELRMEIKVEQDNIKAHITTQNPQAQEMLDRHLPRLREALEQQGLNLEQVEITVASNENKEGQLFQDSQGQNQLNRQKRPQTGQPSFSLLEEEETDVQPKQQENLSVLV